MAVYSWANYNHRDELTWWRENNSTVQSALNQNWRDKTVYCHMDYVDCRVLILLRYSCICHDNQMTAIYPITVMIVVNRISVSRQFLYISSSNSIPRLTKKVHRRRERWLLHEYNRMPIRQTFHDTISLRKSWLRNTVFLLRYSSALPPCFPMHSFIYYNIILTGLYFIWPILYNSIGNKTYFSIKLWTIILLKILCNFQSASF